MKNNKPTRKQIPEKYLKYCDEIQDSDYFVPERDYISKSYGVSQDRIFIDTEHPCGDICIFIDGVWSGYIDETFSEAMRSGLLLKDYESWLFDPPSQQEKFYRNKQKDSLKGSLHESLRQKIRK